MPVPIDEQALGKLIKVLNPYSTDMHQPADPPAAPPAPTAGRARTPPPDPLNQFQIEVADHYQNYTSAEWIFRGQPQAIKKAFRITYRYALKDADGKPTEVYATEHVLIGYAGSNSG